jgi:hypothetical protein
MGNATVTEVIGLFASIVVLAGVSVAIVNGGNTAKVIGAFGKTFNDSLRTATKGGK